MSSRRLYELGMVRLEAKGLVLAPGELSRAPGGLIRADNVNCEAPGIIRSRNGMARQSATFGGPVWKMVSTKELGSNILCNHGSNSAASGYRYTDGTTGPTQVTAHGGGMVNQPATRMQCAVVARNHYLTSDSMVSRLDTDMGLWPAGMPRGIGLDLTGPTAVLVNPTTGTINYDTQTGNFTVGQVLTGVTSGATGTIAADVDSGATGYLSLTNISGKFAAVAEGLSDPITGSAMSVVNSAPAGWLADGSSVAYRVTWAIQDVQGQWMEGSPTGRTVVYNNTRTTGWVTGQPKNVTCRILVPKATNTANTSLDTTYQYRLYRSRAELVNVPPKDDMKLVAEGYLASGDISAGYVDVVDSTPETFRLLGDPLYTNENDGGDVGYGVDGGFGATGVGLTSNDPPPRARDVCLFAGCLFFSDVAYPYAMDLTILSVVAATGCTAGDVLTIGATAFTAVAQTATPSANQFRVVTSAAVSENIERTARNLVECINKSTQTTVWAFYTSSPILLPGKIHIISRLSDGLTSFACGASAHGNAYSPNITNSVNANPSIYGNGLAFSKLGEADGVPGTQLAFVGGGSASILRIVSLGEALFIFTDAGIYRWTGVYGAFSLQEFDLSFRLAGRELLAVCDDAIYAWGYEGIARITGGGTEYISNAIEPLIQDIVNTLGQTWLSSYAFATAFRSRHKVMFFYPALATGNNAGNASLALVFDTRMKAWTRWTYLSAADTDRTTGHSCATVRVSDDLLFLGQWLYAAGDTKLFKERRAYAATDYQDDTWNTVSQPIQKAVTWNAAFSEADKLTHWDELQLLFDVSSVFSAWTTPTALTVRFIADFAASSGASTMSPTALSRVSVAGVPQAQRRSARLSVLVTHGTAVEYFGLEGMVLVHRSAESNHQVRT